MGTGTLPDIDKTAAQWQADRGGLWLVKSDAVGQASTDPAEAQQYTIADWGNMVDDSISALVDRGKDHEDRISVLEGAGATTQFPAFEQVATRTIAFNAAAGVYHPFDATGGTFAVAWPAPGATMHGDMIGLKSTTVDATSITVQPDPAHSMEQPAFAGVPGAILGAGVAAVMPSALAGVVWAFDSTAGTWRVI